MHRNFLISGCFKFGFNYSDIINQKWFSKENMWFLKGFKRFYVPAYSLALYVDFTITNTNYVN